MQPGRLWTARVVLLTILRRNSAADNRLKGHAVSNSHDAFGVGRRGLTLRYGLEGQVRGDRR